MIIISQLRRRLIELKFSQVCYFMHVYMLRIDTPGEKTGLWQLPIVSSVFKFFVQIKSLKGSVNVTTTIRNWARVPFRLCWWMKDKSLLYWQCFGCLKNRSFFAYIFEDLGYKRPLALLSLRPTRETCWHCAQLSANDWSSWLQCRGGGAIGLLSSVQFLKIDSA